MNIVKILEWWWKFSIFGRNSWVLKVLAHEMSDEIQKKLKFLSSTILWREVLIKISKNEYCAKIWVMTKIFNFWSKYWVVMVLAQEMSDEIQKNFKFSSSRILWREVSFKISKDEHSANIWVMMKIFNFWLKFLGFKGVSPRNEWRNLKKKISSSMVWWWKVIIKISKDVHRDNFGVMMEIFNFLSKFSRIKEIIKVIMYWYNYFNFIHISNYTSLKNKMF